MRGLLPVLLALVCVLAACGDDDEAATTTAAAPGLTASTGAAETSPGAPDTGGETTPPASGAETTGAPESEEGEGEAAGRVVAARVFLRTSTARVRMKRGAVCEGDRCTQYDPGTCDDGKVPAAGAAPGEQALFLLDPVPTGAEITVESAPKEVLEPQKRTPWSVSQPGVVSLRLTYGDYAVTYHACLMVYL